MRVRMLATMAGPEGVAFPGQEIEVPAATGEELIAGGYAVAAPEGGQPHGVAPTGDVEEARIAAPERAVGKRKRGRKQP